MGLIHQDMTSTHHIFRIKSLFLYSKKQNLKFTKRVKKGEFLNEKRGMKFHFFHSLSYGKGEFLNEKMGMKFPFFQNTKRGKRGIPLSPPFFFLFFHEKSGKR